MGGKFYFVYLPSCEEYTINRAVIRNKEDTISIVRQLGIDIIDFDDVLRSQKDSHQYFPFKLPNHYNAEGYKLLSEYISGVIN